MHYVRKIEFQLSSRAFPTHNEHRFQLCIGLKSISSSASNDAQTPRPRAIINLSHQSNESVVSSVERQSWGVCIIFGYDAFVSFKSLRADFSSTTRKEWNPKFDACHSSCSFLCANTHSWSRRCRLVRTQHTTAVRLSTASEIIK